MLRSVLAVTACACHAPAPTPVAAPDPLSSMGVTWKIRDASVVAVRPLAILTPRDVQFVDPRDGYRWLAWVGGSSNVAAMRDDFVIASPMQRALIAVDRHRSDDGGKWQYPLSDDELVFAIAADADRVYALLGEDSSEHDALVAIFPRSLTPAWRRELPARCHPVAVYATGIAVCRGDRKAGDLVLDDPLRAYAIIVRFDPATGAPGWQIAFDDVSAVAVDAEHVALARTAALAILDARTGAARETSLSNIRAIALGGDTAYVATGDHVSAIRLDTLVTVWSQRVPRSARIAVGDRAVFIASDGGVLRGLDRATGEARWEWALDGEISLAVDGDRLYASTDSDSVTAFAPGAAAAPFEDAVISGRVDACGGDPAGTVVSAGDVSATVRTDGRFAIHVRARGALRVTAAGGMTWLPASIRLVGHRNYDAGVLAPRCPKALPEKSPKKQ